jgi:hypothetical protein
MVYVFYILYNDKMQFNYFTNNIKGVSKKEISKKILSLLENKNGFLFSFSSAIKPLQFNTVEEFTIIQNQFETKLLKVDNERYHILYTGIVLRCINKIKKYIIYWKKRN